MFVIFVCGFESHIQIATFQDQLMWSHQQGLEHPMDVVGGWKKRANRMQTAKLGAQIRVWHDFVNAKRIVQSK